MEGPEVRKPLTRARGARLLLAVAVAGLLVVGLACSASSEQQRTGTNRSNRSSVSGTVRVSGAWALYPIMVKWGEEFEKKNPGVRVDISAGGAGKGAADALGGLVDIGMVSREIKPEETEQGGFAVPVVKDAVFPTVNEGNPVLWKGLLAKGIKRQTYIDLFIKGKSITWGEITGTDSKDKVQVYTRSDACGAAETWAKYLGGEQEDLRGVAVYGDPGLADAVKKDPLGIGYNNLNYAYDATTGLPIAGIQVVPIDVNENGKVDADEDIKTKNKAVKAITNGVYPSPPARELNLLTKGRFKGAAKAFVEWILSDGQKFVEEVGYIKLTPDQLKDAAAKVRG